MIFNLSMMKNKNKLFLWDEMNINISIEYLAVRMNY